MADKHDFAALVESSLDQVRESAKAWQSGASALITLVTAGLFIKGPDDVAKLTTVERGFVTGFFGVGLVCVFIGLWKILKAAAGTPGPATFPELIDAYGTIKGAGVAEANKAAKQLKVGRGWIVASLALLLIGIVLWWWVAPTPETELRIIVTADNVKICGELQSADEQTIVVKVAGHKNPVEISLANVDDLAVAEACG